MQFKKIAFFAICATILFTGCDSKTEDEKNNTNNVSVKKEVQTKFELEKADLTKIQIEKTADVIKIAGLENKAVLLNFFATWCPPCKAEIPHLNNLRTKFKGDLEVVAVNLGETNGSITTKEALDAFISDFEIEYIVTNGNANFDLSKAMGGIKTIPTMFLLTPEGKIMQKYVGIVPEEMLETDIKKALGK